MIRTQIDGLPLWSFKLFTEQPQLLHAVTTRLGGKSAPPYDTLNLGLHVGDDLGAVVENRRIVSHALGLRFESLTFAQQVHGDAIHHVTSDQRGAGRSRWTDGIPETDGMLVKEHDIAVAIVVADCAPLLLFDPTLPALAVVHAGWRGTSAGIAARAVLTLGRICNSDPRDLLVGIGPTIGPCCYQISDEVAALLDSGDRGTPIERREGNWYADLAAANQRQLISSGVPPDHIECANLCTACHSHEFYSERKLGRPTGRFALFAALNLCMEYRPPIKKSAD